MPPADTQAKPVFGSARACPPVSSLFKRAKSRCRSATELWYCVHNHTRLLDKMRNLKSVGESLRVVFFKPECTRLLFQIVYIKRPRHEQDKTSLVTALSQLKKISI